MYDLAWENEKPGKCGKCRGTGHYAWGGFVNGKPAHTGQCHSCNGTGEQDAKQIRRNAAYNRFKIARICA